MTFGNHDNDSRSSTANLHPKKIDISELVAETQTGNHRKIPYI